MGHYLMPRAVFKKKYLWQFFSKNWNLNLKVKKNKCKTLL